MGKEDMNNSEGEVFSCVGILDPVIAHCFLFKELVLSTQLVSDFFFFFEPWFGDIPSSACLPRCLKAPNNELCLPTGSRGRLTH